MNQFFARGLSIALLLSGALFHSLASAEEEDSLARFTHLLNDSPFLTLAFKERLAQTERTPTRNLSFTGYAKIDGEWLLCIHNKEIGDFNWVRVGETINDFLVKSFDVKKEKITLVFNNREILLALEKP
jgi:hypothetical protein